MNSEMLPFILFLLYSDDLRKQSDRVILEIRNHNDENNKVLGSKLIDALKGEEKTLFDNTKEYLSDQYTGIIDRIKDSNDPKKVMAELIPLLHNEEMLFYNKTIAYLDKQYASIIREIKTRNSKEVAAEIIAALTDDEAEFFDRAANHVYMYYTELKDEIKANSNVQQFSQELSRHLKGNNEILLKLIKEYLDKNNDSNDQANAMEFIKRSITELNEKVNGLGKISNMAPVKNEGIKE